METPLETSMCADEQMDAASLAALAEFLRECETPVDVQHNVVAGGAGEYGDLPLAGHLPVLAETVTPLGQHRDADDIEQVSDGAGTDETRQENSRFNLAAAERRRKIKNAQAAKRRLRYLKKLKTERKTLKKQEEELSAKLKELQEAHANEKTARNKNMLMLSAWKANATRQKERRLESEETQRQLKMAVGEQSTLIHRMGHLMQQHHLLNSTELNEEKEITRDQKGKALLQSFVHEMDSLYAKTDDVIGNVDFGMSPPLTYELTRKWNKDKNFLESADATVIPFSFEQTCRAVSLMILAPSYNDELDDPDNTAIRTYRLNFSRELGNSATLLIYNAVKRYVETDRAVFVWRALAEGQGEFDGLHTVETAWFVVRPLIKAGQTDARQIKNSAMILESYTRLVPVGFGRPSENDARANKFIKVLAKADEADVNDMKQMLGKLLLDETRGSVEDTRHIDA
ncbi:unnamed protein product [Phytophthora fragariaefolia]|uniref:Unnamed protein product n=1 Tax=Phytophthora fragariaefolia TaxID=1490495 RepID=A0A9W6X732_9STRA|nr:unnamed protein product [Phytophthora fragariaefolia]